MTNTALITGASSGIGLELAKIHASKGGNLVLVARSKSKLNALKEELEALHNIHVDVIVLDLSQPGSAQALFEQTTVRGLQIDTLINNAGFGGHGKFHERSLSDDQAMMQVNMVTLTNLTLFTCKVWWHVTKVRSLTYHRLLHLCQARYRLYTTQLNLMSLLLAKQWQKKSKRTM